MVKIIVGIAFALTLWGCTETRVPIQGVAPEIQAGAKNDGPHSPIPSVATASNTETEMEERARISASTQRAFAGEDFVQLEKSEYAYRTRKSRTSSGLWKLTLFYAGIDDAIGEETRGREREEAFQELEARTMRWVQMYPKSPAAHIAYSQVLINHGWAYRGRGFAATVKPESWAPFLQYIAMARTNLETHKAVAAVDPTWYETMLIIARAENWDRSQFDSLLNEAFAREPLHYQTYFMAFEYLLPKWHGSTREIEAFARDAVSRTSGQEGQGMYARIYWYASQTQFQNNLFTESLVTWPSMKDGFEDIVARYPDAWNLNNYAKFACLAQDKPKARELLDRIKTSVVPKAWDPPSLREQCIDWASRQ